MSSLARRLKTKRKPSLAHHLVRRRKREQAREFEYERRALFKRLYIASQEAGEQNPVRFLDFLKDQRRGYDPAHDGPSQLMQLVDDIAALEALEKEAHGQKA